MFNRPALLFPLQTCFIRRCRYLALTYANTSMYDGPGSQLQRVYGIYALSKALKVPYLHAPLLKIGYVALDRIKTRFYDEAIRERFNSRFTIPSDPWPDSPDRACECEAPSWRELLAIRQVAKARREYTLVRIHRPYAITDTWPAIYEAAKEVSPFPSTASSGKPFRIAMHIRRGELVHLKHEQHRMLSIDYYRKLAAQLQRTLDTLDQEYQMDIYTEAAQDDPDPNRFDVFDDMRSTTVHVNLDPVSPLEAMATADLLVTGHSSYSYLAGILNRTATVICHPFWHSPLPSWLIADDTGHVHPGQLDSRIRKTIRQRSAGARGQ
jgi:hypothetical protein